MASLGLNDRQPHELFEHRQLHVGQALERPHIVGGQPVTRFIIVTSVLRSWPECRVVPGRNPPIRR